MSDQYNVCQSTCRRWQSRRLHRFGLQTFCVSDSYIPEQILFYNCVAQHWGSISWVLANPCSLHKYGIRPSAFTVSRVSMAFTPKWNFFTLVPITAMPLRLYLYKCMLEIQKMAPLESSPPPFILLTYTVVCSGINTLFHFSPLWNTCTVSPLFARRMRRRSEPRVWADSQAAQNASLWLRLEDAAQGISPK